MNPQQSYYTRQITRILDVGVGAVQRELQNLTEAGILRREHSGRQVFYSANKDCPIYVELRSLIVKTIGLVDILREHLAPIAPHITVAFVYGSFARGSDTAASDVDLMVVGSVSFSQVAKACGQAETILGREVNPSVYSLDEWRTRVIDADHFILSVLAEPKLFVIGDADVLERLGTTGLVDPAPANEA